MDGEALLQAVATATGTDTVRDKDTVPLEHAELEPQRDGQVVADRTLPEGEREGDTVRELEREPDGEREGEVVELGQREGNAATDVDPVMHSVSEPVAAADGGLDTLDDGHAKLKDGRCVPAIEYRGDAVPQLVTLRVPVRAGDPDRERLGARVALALSDADLVRLGDCVPLAHGATEGELPAPTKLNVARCVPSIE